MNEALKTPIISFLKLVGLYPLYSLKVAGPLKEDGWFRSFHENAPVDADGKPVPWITYPALEFLRKRVLAGMSVFEYGSGGSTLWWASKVKEIVSVEHDKEWCGKIKSKMPGNVTLYHIELGPDELYSKKISEFKNKFDIVVIDGRNRVKCAINSLAALKEDGIIVWDNTERKEYEKGYQYLHENGFRRIEFVGLAPLINYKSETSIFYRQGNCLGI